MKKLALSHSEQCCYLEALLPQQRRRRTGTATHSAAQHPPETSSYTVWEVCAGQCPPFKKMKSRHGGHLLTHKTHSNASSAHHSVLGTKVLPARSPPWGAQKKPPTFPSHLRSIAAARNPHVIRVKRAQAFPITSLSHHRKMTEKLGSWLCGFTGQCPQG